MKWSICLQRAAFLLSHCLNVSNTFFFCWVLLLFLLFSCCNQTAKRSTTTIRYIDIQFSSSCCLRTIYTYSGVSYVSLILCLCLCLSLSLLQGKHIAYTRALVYRSSIQYFFFLQRFLFFSAFLMRSLVHSISFACSILPFSPEKKITYLL